MYARAAVIGRWVCQGSRRASIVHAQADEFERHRNPQNDASREAEHYAPGPGGPAAPAGPHRAQIDQDHDEAAKDSEDAEDLGEVNYPVEKRGQMVEVF